MMMTTAPVVEAAKVALVWTMMITASGVKFVMMGLVKTTIVNVPDVEAAKVVIVKTMTTTATGVKAAKVGLA
jgi:hypothetical protein